MEDTALALLTLYGIDTGLKHEKFYISPSLCSSFPGTRFPATAGRRRRAVPDRVGIIASWYQNCGDENATELFPFHWDVVGQSPVKVVMGKGSGIDSVKNG